MQAYRAGDIQVMMNCEVLTRGLDIPDIEVGILARPTRSLSLHIQMLGRVLRTAEGKDKALYLDHAGNIERLGFPDDDLPTELNMQERGVSTTDHRDKAEPTPWTCPKCYTIVEPKTGHCPACGFVPKPKAEVRVESGVLTRMRKAGRSPDKQTVYSMLNCVRHDKGYQKGWVAHAYREIFGVWPVKMQDTVLTPSPEIRGWLTHRNIKRARTQNG
jgi:superfamily II DNA or RNA helicase